MQQPVRLFGSSNLPEAPLEAETESETIAEDIAERSSAL